MTVDLEPDPDQKCPECGSSDVLPFQPNTDTSSSLSFGLNPLGITREKTIGKQYLHVEYCCNNCGNEFHPQSASGKSQGEPYLSIDKTVTIPTDSGEVESEVLAIDATIQVGFPDGKYRFTGQIIIDQPVGNDEPVVAYSSDGGPIGIAWASSEEVSLINPFPAFPEPQMAGN